MPTELRLHHCTVDLARAKACWTDREVNLTDAEVKLLAFLAERSSEDVPRGDLLQHVWGYSPTVRSRAVDQTVKRLRPKIEADPAAPDSLLSVYGVGYRLVLPVAESAARLSMTPGRVPTLTGTTHGRAALLETLRNPVQDGPARVLTGPPGVGKSRVALAFAAAVRAEEDPEGGVWVVDCDPIRSADGLLEAIQHTLSLPESSERNTTEVGQCIHRRGHALVVLDNCDAVDGLYQTVLELASISGVRWLVTTRQRLGPELPHTDIRPLAPDDALALFQERAAWVAGPRTLPERDTRRLIEALECNPLALCLAAARSNLLEPAALLERFQSDPKLLSISNNDEQQRYSSLERALAGSWALLTADEQNSLVALTVFSGTFTLEAAEAVVGTGAIDKLQRLSDQSLLEPRNEALGRVYRLPLLVRSFASSRSPKVVRDAWSRLEAHLADLHTRFWTAPTAFAWDSVLPLLRHRSELERAFRTCEEPERTVRLGLALAEVERLGGNAYAQTRVLRTLQRTSAPQDPDLALYLGTLTAANHLIHRTPEARQTALEALRPLVASCRTQAAPVHWLRTLGSAAMPDLDRLHAVSEQLRAWAERCTEPLWEAVALLFIGRFHGFSGHMDLAVDCFEHALSLCADRGLPLLHAYALYSRGYAAMEQDELDTADACFQDASRLLAETGDPRSTMLIALQGMVAMLDDRLDDAETHFRASARYAHLHVSGWAREDEYFMGCLAILRGDLQGAEQWFSNAVELGRRWGAGPGVSAPLLAATRVALGESPARVQSLLRHGPSWSPFTRAAHQLISLADQGTPLNPEALDSPSPVSTTLAQRFLAGWSTAYLGD